MPESEACIRGKAKAVACRWAGGPPRRANLLSDLMPQKASPCISTGWQVKVYRIREISDGSDIAKLIPKLEAVLTANRAFEP